MTASRLTTRRVEKPWGRTQLWPGFADADKDPVGEIWFEAPDGQAPELLIKYLFTSEKLSIQVHPNDAQARERGYPRGKEEAWVILAAEPDAVIGLGLTRTISPEALRAAALDGSIEQMMDWRPVKAGDILYSPAGTIHAIGPGLTLIEAQQNVDLTYRLYDYGRPRELHLDDGIAVSKPEPFTGSVHPRMLADNRELLIEGGKFILERWRGAYSGGFQTHLPVWMTVVTGAGAIDGQAFSAGECWLVHNAAQVALAARAEILLAYPGQEVMSAHIG